ncbi:PepSY-associated TM helix domain-containing protein [Bergeyella sp. RCAD1439]|nr:PepSY-associated TM helix domain-containing protein [Bergeyella sp. RCAD1439]
MYLLHLWLGLWSSLVVFILCFTGSLYAFKTQISEWYNADKVFVEVGQERASAQEVQQALEAEGKTMTSLVLPQDFGRSWGIGYLDEGGASRSVFYDPYMRRELGTGDDGLNRFFEVVLDLHRNLMLGSVGRQVVGASVLMFLGLLLSGLVLWFPKKMKYLKQGLTIKFKARFQRLNYDLHNVLGFYLMLFLAFIAITGLYVTYPWVKNALIVSLGGEPLSEIKNEAEVKDEAFASIMGDMLNRQKEKTTLKDEKPVSVGVILAATDRLFPSSGTVMVEFPNEENPRFTVRKINSDNALGALLPDELSFDKKGVLKSKILFMDKPLDKQFTSLAKPLHTGEIMGLPSIIFYFFVSLLGSLLPVTGVLIWWHRLKKMS